MYQLDELIGLSPKIHKHPVTIYALPWRVIKAGRANRVVAKTGLADSVNSLESEPE